MREENQEQKELLKAMGRCDLEGEFYGDFFFVRDVIYVFAMGVESDAGFDTLEKGTGGHLLDETIIRLEKLNDVFEEMTNRLIKFERQAQRDSQPSQ